MESRGVKVEVKKLPELRTAYVMHMKGYEDSEGIANAYEKLCAWAGPRGYMSSDTKFIGISLDDPGVTPKHKCRYYACIAIGGDAKAQGEVGVMAIPAGSYAVARFQGKKDNIFKDAYDYMFGAWLPKSGYQPEDSFAFEQYLTTPEDHPKGYFVFDLHIPVKPL